MPLNPIVQAMLANVQAQQQAQQQAEVERSNKAHETQAAEQLAELKQQHKDDFEHNKGMLENATQLLQSQLKTQHLMRTKELADLVSSGKTKPQDVPGMIGMQQIPGVEGLFTQGAFASPEDLAKQEAATIKAKTEAQLGAAEPFKEKDDAREAQKAMNLAEFNRASAERVNRQTRETQLEVANINSAASDRRALIAAHARMDAAARSGVSVDPQVMDSYINDSYITGNTQEQQIPQKLRPSIRAAVPKGWTPLTKADNDQIGGIALVDDLLNSVRTLSSAGSGVMGRASAAIGIGKAGEAQRAVDGLLGNIARIFGGEKGVLTERDLTRARELTYSILNSDKANKDNPEKLEKFFKEKLRSVTGKYDPDQLEQIFAARGLSASKWSNKGDAVPATGRRKVDFDADGNLVEVQ